MREEVLSRFHLPSTTGAQRTWLSSSRTQSLGRERELLLPLTTQKDLGEPNQFVLGVDWVSV